MINKTILFYGVFSLCQTSLTQAKESKPNIIVMFIDDYGYNDMGHKNPSFSTPNIDSLAQNSLNFTNAYVPSPTSSPSRVALLTGRHPLKVGVIRHISKESGDPYGTGEWTYSTSDPGKQPNRQFLPLKEVTLAETLKEAGYITYHIGKWHLGNPEYYPDKQGFKHTYGESDLGQPYNYFPPYFTNQVKADSKGQYLNDNLTDQAVEWIKNHDYSKAPLMMYFAHYAVHNPYIGQAEKIKKYLRRGLNKEYATYHAMVESMDESVGRIMNALKENHIDDNTIFIFTSDQGGYFSNAPLKGGKMNGALYEGGCRVPLFIHYPHKNKKNIKEITERVTTLDIYPTLIDLAGIKYLGSEKLDGTSLKKTIESNSEPKAKAIYFYRSYDDQPASIILNNFKLIYSRSGNHEMYNLMDDQEEKENIISNPKYDKIKSKLYKLMSEFLKQYEMPQIEI